jgi:hypothetical protein
MNVMLRNGMSLRYPNSAGATEDLPVRQDQLGDAVGSDVRTHWVENSI